MSDQSDKDEQKGFMMMFSGPLQVSESARAQVHSDDPERALEFIAFTSLLCQLSMVRPDYESSALVEIR
jgi:hypothetical protein